MRTPPHLRVSHPPFLSSILTLACLRKSLSYSSTVIVVVAIVVVVIVVVVVVVIVVVVVVVVSLVLLFFVKAHPFCSRDNYSPGETRSSFR